ncbi:MAG: phosphoribosylglycinamide formyltransferase [Spirochaetaceae bacterium]|nr:phosphoribosylglycinamide formyltransferase [Spirochaetaceae bacterium]
MLQIAVLISGGGSNLQCLIDTMKDSGEKEFSICTVISDREASGLKRAEKAGIETHLVDRKIGRPKLSEEINRILSGKADYIILAGFLSILEESFIEQWMGKIINIHPSLLPDFGGKGMYGMHVHEAVIQAGAEVSGCTVHFVDKGIDTGEIINQMSISVDRSWDAVRLQKEVLKLEHKLLPQTVHLLCEKGINL